MMSKDILQLKYEELDAEFKKSYPLPTDEGMMHYVGLEKDVRTTKNYIKLGFTPLFAIVEKGIDFEKAEETVNKRTFKGSFSPVRLIPYSGSKYQPHQSTQECTRRVRQMENNKLKARHKTVKMMIEAFGESSKVLWPS